MWSYLVRTIRLCTPPIYLRSGPSTLFPNRGSILRVDITLSAAVKLQYEKHYTTLDGVETGGSLVKPDTYIEPFIIYVMYITRFDLIYTVSFYPR